MVGIVKVAPSASATTTATGEALQEDFVITRRQDTTTIYAVEDELEFDQRRNGYINSQQDSISTVSTMSELEPVPKSDTIGLSSIGDATTSSVFPGAGGGLSNPLDITQDETGNQSSTIMTAAIKDEMAWKPSGNIQSYLKMMLLFGTSRYMTDRLCQLVKDDWIWWILDKFQMVLFCSVAFLAGFDSICNAKHCLLYLFAKSEYTYLVRVSHYVVCFVIIVYSANLFSSRHVKTVNMIEAVEKYENVSKLHGEQEGVASTWIVKMPHFLAFGTVILACMRSLFDYGLEDWSVEDTILDSSHRLSVDLLNWDVTNPTNKTVLLFEEYGTNLSITTVSFGLITIVRKTAFHMQLGMIWDLVLMIAWTIYTLMMPFIREVRATIDNAPINDEQAGRDLQRRRENAWLKYEQLKDTVQGINDLFGSLLKFFHVANVLLYAFFIILCFHDHDRDASAITYCLLACKLIKAEVTYILAARVAEQNFLIRKWIRQWTRSSGKFSVNGMEMDAGVILDELNDEPIGLGKGNFTVHESFHFKFLGLVGSLYFSLADDLNKASASQ